jgi:hypothetical protein
MLLQVALDDPSTRPMAKAFLADRRALVTISAPTPATGSLWCRFWRPAGEVERPGDAQLRIGNRDPVMAASAIEPATQCGAMDRRDHRLSNFDRVTTSAPGA